MCFRVVVILVLGVPQKDSREMTCGNISKQLCCVSDCLYQRFSFHHNLLSCHTNTSITLHMAVVYSAPIFPWWIGISSTGADVMNSLG
jgi:hypothetical protein